MTKNLHASLCKKPKVVPPNCKVPEKNIFCLHREQLFHGDLTLAMQNDSSRGSVKSTASSSEERKLWAFEVKRINLSIYLIELLSAPTLLLPTKRSCSTSKADCWIDLSGFSTSSASTGPSARLSGFSLNSSVFILWIEDICIRHKQWHL